MYVSNESATLVDVYFDDVTMTHTKNNIVQYNEYYPFGMQTANSWTRENTLGNNFLANGGTELNTTSNLYDLEYRNYDPVLGRMNQVDPMASKYASLTPYNFSFNDPVTFNDPNGADPLYSETTRAMFGENMQGGYFKPRIMDNGVFGLGHITPGSGGNWSDQYRSVGMNWGLMSNSTFRSTYSQQLNNQYDTWAIGKSIANATYNPIYKNRVNFEQINRAELTSLFYITRELVGFKIGDTRDSWIAINQTNGGWPCSTCPQPGDKGSDAFYTQLQQNAAIEALVLLGFDRTQAGKDVQASSRYGAVISKDAIKNYTSKLQGGYFDSHSFSFSAFQSGALSNSMYAVKIYESGSIGIVYTNLIDHVFEAGAEVMEMGMGKLGMPHYMHENNAIGFMSTIGRLPK